LLLLTLFYQANYELVKEITAGETDVKLVIAPVEYLDKNLPYILRSEGVDVFHYINIAEGGKLLQVALSVKYVAKRINTHGYILCSCA